MANQGVDTRGRGEEGFARFHDETSHRTHTVRREQAQRRVSPAESCGCLDFGFELVSGVSSTYVLCSR